MAKVYLGVFVIGFSLSVVTFLMGLGGHSFGAHGHTGGGHGGHGGHGHGDGSMGVPLVNFGTVTAFMTWFGGIGFLLSTHSPLVVLPVIVVAAVAGVTGAGVVLVFMRKVLMRDQVPMRAADYEMPGVLGRVTVTIPPGGTGEIVYTQGGARKTAAARALADGAIGKGTEVVVMRYEHGVAHVRRWDEVAAEKGVES